MAAYSSYSDEALISLLQAGERAAFDEIYERYWDKLFVTASYRLGSPYEAEDLVQDVMLRLWNNRQGLSLQATLGTYLAVAVKYEVINRLAKQKRVAGYKATAKLSEADHSTEQVLSFSALQQRLAVLVNALPEKCRMAFTLSRNEGLSQKEIAERMGISQNTVESHIKKAIRDIKTGLRHFVFSFF